jgi:hypothetical protein
MGAATMRKRANVRMRLANDAGVSALKAITIAAASSLLCARVAAQAEPAEDLEPEPLVPGPGTAVITIAGDGADVRAELVGLAVSFMGFEHAPKGRLERESFRLTRENLETGDGLIRFNTRAACRLTGARVDMGASPSKTGGRMLSASYGFRCSQPESLDSAALGLFVAFPALERVFVRYELGGVRGAAELNMPRPVVSFVPLY